MNKISISEDIYNELSPEEQNTYQMVYEKSFSKYGQDKYYTMPIVKMKSPLIIEDKDLQAAKDYANGDNLKDIDFSGVRSLLSFSGLSKTQCKKLQGIPIFADVRGFTTQFDEDDSNLEVMAQKTQDILEVMYQVSTEYGGVHVQFQGDRELSLYHNVPDRYVDGVLQSGCMCFKSAVLASMRMIDKLKSHKVHIGIGGDFGNMFATKIGARGEKDNILLGQTVIQADVMEDKYADVDQIAITTEVYEGLKVEDSNLANIFKAVGSCYITTIGYDEYLRKASYKQQRVNTTRNAYNGAWRGLSNYDRF